MYYHNDFIEDVASFYERLTRKEQYPTVDPQFSDVQSSMVIIPRVTNIRKTMSIKPSSSRSVGQEHPEAEHIMASGAGSTCVWPEDQGLWGRRVAEAGEDSCRVKIMSLGRVSRHPQHIYRAGGEVMKIKPLNVHCQQPHRGRCWQLSTS